MFWIHLLVVLVFIFIGARKGGIAIGFAGGAGVLALALLAGLQVGRWLLLLPAIVQWHGAYVFWQTLPRVNVLRSLTGDPGPVTGRLPGSPGEAVSRFRDDTRDIANVLDVWLDLLAAGITILQVAANPYVTVLGDRGSHHPIREARSQGNYRRLQVRNGGKVRQARREPEGRDHLERQEGGSGVVGIGPEGQRGLRQGAGDRHTNCGDWHPGGYWSTRIGGGI